MRKARVAAVSAVGYHTSVGRTQRLHWEPLMLPGPSRLRRVLKWCGVTACIVTLAGYPLSYDRGIQALALTWIELGIKRGRLVVAIDPQYLEFDVFDECPHWRACPELVWELSYWKRNYGIYLTFPLWVQFLAIAIPTALFWHRDRKTPASRGCGYNLTGNVSGVCQECETPVANRLKGREAGRQEGI